MERRFFGQRIVLLGALFFSAVAAPPALAADCSEYTGGLRRKMDEYVAYRNRNIAQQTTLSTTENSCTAGGTSIASSVAKMANAYSCQAEMDASGLHGKIKQLGGSCEAKFDKIHTFQIELRAHFEEAKNELDETFRVLEATHILDFDCGSDVASTKLAVAKFIALESDISHVRDESKDGKVHYGKVKELSAKLESVTGNRGASCGDAVSQMSAAFASEPHGFASASGASSSGRAPSSASDVTGTQKSDGSLGSNSSASVIARPSYESGVGGASALGGSTNAASAIKMKFDASDAAKEFGENSGALSKKRVAGKVDPHSVVGTGAASVKEILSQAKAFGVQDLPGTRAVGESGTEKSTKSSSGPPSITPTSENGSNIELNEVDLFARVHDRYRFLGF
jgi:hypothetical protein